MIVVVTLLMYESGIELLPGERTSQRKVVTQVNEKTLGE